MSKLKTLLTKAVSVKAPHHYEEVGGKRKRMFGKRDKTRLEKLMTSGRAEIAKKGSKYHVRVKPKGNVRFKNLDGHTTMHDAKWQVLDHFHPAKETVVVPEGKERTKTQREVDTKVATQQKSKSYYDVGQKIGGAKKDISALKEQFAKTNDLKVLARLEKSDPDAALRAVNKAAMWPKPDFKKYKKKNPDDPMMFILAAVLRNAVAPKPVDESEEGRRQYTAGINMVRDIIESSTSGLEMVRKVQGMAKEAEAAKYSRYNINSKATDYQKAIFEISKTMGDRFVNFLRGYKSVNKISLNRIANDASDLANKDSRYPEYRERLFKTRWDDATALAGEGRESAKKQPKQKTEIERWKRSEPETYERSGGKKVTVRRPEDYLSRFGLRGVEFGNWMDDKSSRVHVERCAEAFQDLADLLDIDSQDLSMHGQLALAFGARGGGRFKAHYEPLKRVINLTKLGGAGSLGHEWAHFMDNMSSLASGASTEMTSDSVAKIKFPLAAAVPNAYRDVMKAIYNGTSQTTIYPPEPDATETTTSPLGMGKVTQKRRKYSFSAVNMLLDSGKSPQEAMDAIQERYPGTNSAKLRQVADSIFDKTGVKTLKVKSNVSQFVANSKNMSKTPGDNYWTRPHELFARAFETYLLDKMDEKGIHNNYLAFHKGLDNPKAPYPNKEERKKLKPVFDALIKELKASNTLKKAFEMMELNKAHATKKLQGKMDFQGLKISIENKKGTWRKDKNDPPKWKTKMLCHYGYIRGSQGVDDDHADVYVGDNTNAKNAYIVKQMNPQTGAFDEQKCMLGFNSKSDAKSMYLKHYNSPKFFGGIKEMPMEEFKSKVLETLPQGGALIKAVTKK